MEEEIDIKDLIIALWKKKVFIIIVTIIFFVIVFLRYGIPKKANEVDNIEQLSNPSKTSEVVYEVKDNCYIIDFMFERGMYQELDGVQTTYKISIDQSVVTNLNKFATSENFLNTIIDEMNLEDIMVDEFKERISFYSNGVSDIGTLVIDYDNDEIAYEILERILKEILDKSNKLYGINEIIKIDGPRKLNKTEVEELEERINGQMTVLDENAVEDINEVEKPSTKKVLLFTVVGFVTACGILVVIELFNDSVKNEKTLEKITNAKVFANISKNEKDVDEKINWIRVLLGECKAILLTSAEIKDKDNVTFIAKKLQKSYEEIGKKAVFVEAKDLTEQKLNEIENLNDIVIINSDCVLDSSKTLTAVKYTKNIILVSREHKTNINKIIKAKTSIEEIGGKLLGNIFMIC